MEDEYTKIGKMYTEWIRLKKQKRELKRCKSEQMYLVFKESIELNDGIPFKEADIPKMLYDMANKSRSIKLKLNHVVDSLIGKNDEIENDKRTLKRKED